MIIKLDGKTQTGYSRIAEALYPCDDWDRAEFRYPNPIADWRKKHATACNVKLTGKAIISAEGALWRRGQVEWVQDDEPSTFSGCLVKVLDYSGEVDPYDGIDADMRLSNHRAS
jgi:hypothetical protein